jgi:hypothetical protein
MGSGPWRQHRIQFLAGAALLAAFAVLIVITGAQVANQFHAGRLAGFIAVRAVITLYLRPHYMSAVTVFYKLTSGFTPSGSYWSLASGILGPNGQLINQNTNLAQIDGIPVNYLPASCAAPVHGSTAVPPSCAQALTHFRGFLTYQPANRYWTFQGIETGIFLVLAAALIAVTAAVLLRRDA